MSRVITLLGNHWPQKDQQTYIKPYSKITHVSQRRKGRGSKGRTPQENSKGGSPGALLLQWTVKAELDVHCVSKMPTPLIPAVFPDLLSDLAIDLIFSNVLCEESLTAFPAANNPSMGTIPELFTTQMCLMDQCWPPLCYVADKTVVCLYCKATRLNSFTFTKCLKITEHKSAEYKQQQKDGLLASKMSLLHTKWPHPTLWCHKHTFKQHEG